MNEEVKAVGAPRADWRRLLFSRSDDWLHNLHVYALAEWAALGRGALKASHPLWRRGHVAGAALRRVGRELARRGLV